MTNQLKTFCLFIFILSVIACKKDEVKAKEIPQISDNEVPNDLKINQIQYLGSHNSYRKKTDEDILNFITSISSSLPAEFNPIELDYDHISLKDQFTFYGVRQIELDLYLDQYGGLFYNRKGYNLVGEDDVTSYVSELQEPGIKLLHIPDVDFNTHNYTLISALKEIKEWSTTYPDHIPIFILLELKTTTINTTLPGVGFAETESWDNMSALASLEDEILSVFHKSDIITPDDVRGDYNTLNEAVLNHNWPTIEASRGKVIFLFDNATINSEYTSSTPNLEGRLIFTNSTPGNDDAAFVKQNDIVGSLNNINTLAEQGYLIRTRVDEGTYEARNNDYSKWILAIESGAHLLSTDYYKADDRAGDDTWSFYKVEFNNKLYNLNSFTANP